jgi:hypothetical protein
MVLANITDYSVGLFIHIVAVVLTFGPTSGTGSSSRCCRSIRGPHRG